MLELGTGLFFCNKLSETGYLIKTRRFYCEEDIDLSANLADIIQFYWL